MAISGTPPVGDDQKWKKSIDARVKELERLVAILTAQLNSRGQ